MQRRATSITLQHRQCSIKQGAPPVVQGHALNAPLQTASTRWIGPSPNPRSCRAPSVKDRHGEGKREHISEAWEQKARQSTERLQQRERSTRLLTARQLRPPLRLPILPRCRHQKNRSRTSQPTASNRAGVSHADHTTSEPFDAVF